MLSDVELVIDRQNKDAETMSNNQEIKMSSKSNKAYITDLYYRLQKTERF